MGFTRYYKNPKGFTTEQWNSLMVAANQILKSNSVPISEEYDLEDSPPLVENNLIKFNGVGEDGHETFLLMKAKRDFAFCKTARKPYDDVVKAVLKAASDINPNFIVTSDE